jgi:hypothetical protein
MNMHADIQMRSLRLVPRVAMSLMLSLAGIATALGGAAR